MKYTQTESRLMDAMSRMDIIDCHEHLPPEHERTGSPQDVFTLFSMYTGWGLFSAGMDRGSRNYSPWSQDREDYFSLFDPGVPLQKRWELFQPHWKHIRHSSPARAALLTARMVYGVDDINESTYRVLSEKIAQENTPGIYRRMLCDRCRIRAVLDQSETPDIERPLVPVIPLTDVGRTKTRDSLEKISSDLGIQVRTVEDYLELIRRHMDRWVGKGAVGIKILSKPNGPPNLDHAEAALNKLLDGKPIVPESSYYTEPFEPLENYLTHKYIQMATELDLVVSVHAGVWGDFRDLDPKHMLALAPAYPDTDFDLQHLGMPYVRDTITIARNLPNIYLNLCWSHVISQAQMCSGIDEMLDQVPVNKVLAFGGDYVRPVEKVVGHLHMARENFARVFGSRIDRGVMSFDEAVEILRLWFWENPRNLYTRLVVS
jgi:uncharacterized protein